MPKHFSRSAAALFAVLPLGCGPSGSAPPTTSPQVQPQISPPPATLPENPTPTTRGQPAAPPPTYQAVTAEKMAQDFIDDTGTAYMNYGKTPPQLTGVIASGEDRIRRIQTAGKRDGRPTPWTFVLVFPKGVNTDGIDAGKRVTVRGTLAATGGGTTTIDVAEVVPD